tara:strand:- start:100 stop:255 length:156 start_codon:yes stop_codon:yes gene_type:complete
MNLVMFIIGTVVFSTYIIGLVWNIGYSTKESKEENYGYYTRHNQPKQDELK